MPCPFVHDFAAVPVSVRTTNREHHATETDPDLNAAELAR